MKKNYYSSFDIIKKRKLLSTFMVLVIVGIGYYAYGKIFSTAGIPSYIVTNVKRGNISITVNGTGQISAKNQLDIKSKASGDLVYLNNQANGTLVKKGTLIAQVDTRDIAISLQNAKIAYAKLIKQADIPTLLQYETNLKKAIDDNKKDYDDAFGYIASSFTDMPIVLNGLKDLLYSQSGYLRKEAVRVVSPTALGYQESSEISFDKTQTDYFNLLIEFKQLSRSSSTSTIESFIGDTYRLSKEVSDTVKNIQNTLEYVRTQRNDGTGATESANLTKWTSTINTDLSNLLSAKDSLTTSLQDIDQKTADYNKLINGPDALDIASQKLDLQQKQNAYDDYFIRAPFDGILARLSVKNTDTVNSGTVIGTLVSSERVANITLNEVDVEKVKVGQKVKLSFDAISDLKIDGTVTTVDLVGTVSQGVVNYNVEISLDQQDERIKPGMTVTADIITDTKDDVLFIPNSSIKSQGKNSYVEMFANPITVTKGTIGTQSTEKPIQRIVETGISNDSMTEIISGLNEGEQVIVRTIIAAVKTNTTPTIFGAATGGRTGGTGIRTGGTGIRNN